MAVRTFVPLLLLVASVAHAGDKHLVNLITSELDTIERHIAEDDLHALGMEGRSLAERFTEADKNLKTDPAFPGLVQRWEKIAAKAAAAAGGHSTQILGDGRVPPDDPERAELFKTVEDACMAGTGNSSAGNLKRLKESYAQYEKALARAMKADPTSVRHKYGHFKLFECEWTIGQLQMDLEDRPEGELNQSQAYTACGYDEWVLRRLKMGGKWGPWEVDGVPGKNGYPLECKKHPKTNKISGNMASLFRQEFKYPSNAVWQITGSATTARVGLDTYQYQSVRVYAKEITIQTSDCGEKDKKVVCEASGAGLVQAYNTAAYQIARAELHRSSGRAERCKKMYKEAASTVKNTMSSYESESKSSSWDKTLKYKTRNDGIMNETKLIARLTEMGEQAEDRSIGKYCQK